MDPVQVMAPPVDIDTDSDNNGSIDQTPYEDSIEAGGSGGYGGYCGNILHWNHDDDNGNSVEDRLEGPGPLQLPGGGPFNDDDLEPAILKVDYLPASAWASGAAGGSQGLLNGVKLQISHTANLALWRTQNKEPLALTYTFTSNGPPSNVPNEIWVEGREVGGGSVTWALFAPTEANPGGEVVASDVVDFTVTDAVIDLDAEMVYHNAPAGDLPDDLEDYPGAFVPMNNDDDDYDPANLADLYQSGAIAGESDLLPIVLHQIEPSSLGGTYRLHIPPHVHVWYNADRTGAVSDLSTFSAAAEDETLYVEGSLPGAGILYVDWWNDSEQINAADRVTVTVFEWEGPLNVPDHSIHKYTASGAASGIGNSQWLGAENGSFVWSFDGDSGPDEAMIKWNGGSAVGKAVYQAEANYIWDLEVNLVQVGIGPPDGENAFSPGTPFDLGSGLENGVLHKAVSSGDPAGLIWRAKVSLDGPNGDRGVKFMRIGFVQNVDIAALNGYYSPTGKTLTSSIQGESYLDAATSSGELPYYSTGAHAVFFDPDPSASPPRKVKTIVSGDVPAQGVPLTFQQHSAVQSGDDIVDVMNIVFDFDLFVTARTTDPRNAANQRYTSRAFAHWLFNGSGSVGQTAPYPWTPGSGAGNSVLGWQWTAVTDGSQPPISAPPLVRDAAQTMTWSE